jgi:Domain of unknown function (DUF4405)
MTHLSVQRHQPPSNGPVAVRSTLVLYLDVALLLLFIVLLSPNLTGLPVHEWLGLAFIPPLVVHLLFARSWVTRTVRTFFSTSRWRTRLNFALNALLFVLMVVEIFSGLEISQVALPRFGFAGIDDHAWRTLHNEAARWVELTVCMHIAMNWSWIEGVLVRAVDAAGLNAKKTVIAPNRLVASIWIFIVLLASALVATATYKEVGAPTLLRLYQQNEIAHYRSTLGTGVFEILFEILFIVLFTVIGRICLRLRL